MTLIGLIQTQRYIIHNHSKQSKRQQRNHNQSIKRVHTRYKSKKVKANQESILKPQKLNLLLTAHDLIYKYNKRDRESHGSKGSSGGGLIRRASPLSSSFLLAPSSSALFLSLTVLSNVSGMKSDRNWRAPRLKQPLPRFESVRPPLGTAWPYQA